MSIYETKKSCYLGKAPTHIEKDKLVEYFLYTFEFIWTSPAYEANKESILSRFKQRLSELRKKNESPLSLAHEWWALGLFALKDLVEFENRFFAVETIQYLLNRLHTLSEEELEDYINSLNNVLADEVPDVLSIRPLEIQPLQSDADQNDKVLAYFLESKEPFLSVFKKHLVQKDIESLYINQLAVNDKKMNYQFTNFWNSYFEIFVGFSLSMFDMVRHAPEFTAEKSEQLIKEINLVFLITSVKNREKIDRLNNELTELLKPLYRQYLS